jgi:ribose 5-phosphate isomerase A
VVPFAWESHVPFLQELGARAVVRSGPGGELFLTDNGNIILDCHFPQGIGDAPALQIALAGRAGVVESGLFLGMAAEVLVGGEVDVMTMTRKEAGVA